MASFGFPIGYYHPHLVQGQGPLTQYPYRTVPAISAHPCLQCAHLAHENTTLASRVIVLETQLAQAIADKKAGDDATLHLLHLQSVQPLVHTQDAASRSEIAALDRKLLQVTIENYRLKDELQKVIEERELGNSHARTTSVTDFSQSVYHGCSSKSSKDIRCPTPEDLLDLTDEESRESDELVEVEGQFSAESIYGKCSDAVTTNKAFVAFTTPSISLESSYLYHFEDKKVGCNMPLTPECSCGRDAYSILAMQIANLLFSTQAFSSNDHTSSILGYTKAPNRNLSLQLHAYTSGSRPNVLEISQGREVHNKYLLKSNEATHSATHGSPLNHVGKVEPLWQTEDIFDSVDERKQLGYINQAEAGRDDTKLPGMFKHGLRFNPGLKTTNVIRALTIGNLPSKLTVAELINVVRGGPIVDVQLVDTTAITGTRTALVTFRTEYSALAFEEFAESHGIMFHGQPAHVTVITTPTYPMSLNASVAIFAKNHTRCLEIRNFPRYIKPSELRQDLRISPVLTIDAIESLKMDKAGVLKVRFTSIWYAGKAYTFLTSKGKYRACRIVFSPDPCDRPLEAPMKEKDGIDTSATHDVTGTPQANVEDALHDISEDCKLAENGSGLSSETEDVSREPGIKEKVEQEEKEE